MQKSNLSSVIFTDVVPKTPNFCDLTGQVFGDLIVRKLIGRKIKSKKGYGVALWLCDCKCGGWIHATVDYLKQGRTRSCGCFKQGIAETFLLKHGAARDGKDTPEYLTYLSAKNRCQNPNNRSYYSYGGRGIEFKFTSFAQFLEELGYKPSIWHSLDRIDPTGNYEPGNVRWATRMEQANNTTLNKFITWKGKTQTLAQWVREVGLVKYGTVNIRLNRGWCIECSLTLPNNSSCKHRLKI